MKNKHQYDFIFSSSHANAALITIHTSSFVEYDIGGTTAERDPNMEARVSRVIMPMETRPGIGRDCVCILTQIQRIETKCLSTLGNAMPKIYSTWHMLQRYEHGEPCQAHEECGWEISPQHVVAQVPLQLQSHHHRGKCTWKNNCCQFHRKVSI